MTDPLLFPEIPRSLARDVHVITACMVVMVLVIVGVLLYQLEIILKPLFVAAFVYYLVKSGADGLARLKVPRMLANLLLLCAILIIFLVAGLVTYANVQAIQQRLPEYQVRMLEWLNYAARKTGYANEQGLFDWEKYSLGDLLNLQLADVVKWAFGTTVEFLGTTLAVVFYLVFIILQANKMPARITRAFPPDTASNILEIGDKITQDIKRYLLVKTGISLGTAVFAAIIMSLFGLSFWPLWAILTFLFNFIPYIGSIVVTIFPITLSFLQMNGTLVPVMMSLLLISNQVLWGNFLEPQFTGQKLNISPIVLLLFLAFWGWTWGIVGMVLAVPLATTIRIIFSNFERTRKIAILTSGD